MGDLITEHMLTIKARRLSPTTIRAHAGTLRRLAEHLGKPLEEATAADLVAWQAHTAGRVAARTLRTQTSIIRAFYRWAYQSERIPHDPAQAMRSPKVPRLLPRPIPDDELAVALHRADATMRAVLTLAAFSGLRAAEIAGLTWGDVDLGEHARARVLGKGSIERIVDLPGPVVEALRALPGARRGPVIRRADGQAGPCSPNLISKSAARHLRACGVDRTLHSLRHRFGTVVCRIGGVRRAQEALGHLSITSTTIYTQVAQSEIRAVVEQASLLDGVDVEAGRRQVG